MAVATAATESAPFVFCLDESSARKEYFYASESDLLRNSIVSLFFFKVLMDSDNFCFSSPMTLI